MWDYTVFLENDVARIGAIILIISFLTEIFYITFFYYKAVFGRVIPKDNMPPVSVIITAHNEAHNLEKFLPLVLKQDYPDYEVIVVNHASTDGTDLLLKRLSHEYKHLVIRNIPYSQVSTHTKKFALTMGIRAAKNDVLLFTDADCYPASDQWIRKMVSHFDDETKIVLGYGKYEKSSGLLDKHLRTDTMMIAMQYFGFAMQGMPYMGVGRNIAWRKSFFDEKGGFQNHIFEPSGSDDLFVNHNGNKHNTAVELDPQSFTISVPPSKWKHLMYQKRRHFGAARFYRPVYKFLLALEPISRIIFLTSGLILSIVFNNLIPAVVITLRELMLFIAIAGGVRRFKEKGILFYALLYDLYQPFFNLIIYLGRNKHNGQAWR